MTTYGNYGVFGHGTFGSTARSWYTFLVTFMIFSPLCPIMPLVFGWRIGYGITGCKSIREALRQINWLYVWLGTAPLLILILLKSWFKPYGFIAIIGLYLMFMFPFKYDKTSGFFSGSRKIGQLIFLLCAILTASAFVFQMCKNHSRIYISREKAQKVCSAILQHAKLSNQKHITIDIATHGPMNFGNISSLFIFQTDLTVNNPIVNVPGLLRNSLPTINIVANARHNMLHQSKGITGTKKELHDKHMELVDQTDYFIVMGPRALMLSKDIVNIKLSRLLLTDPQLHPITPPLLLNNSYDVQVLARNKH